MENESIISDAKNLKWITDSFEAVPLEDVPESTEKENATDPNSVPAIDTSKWVGPPNPEFAIGILAGPLATWVIKTIGPAVLKFAILKMLPASAEASIDQITSKGKNDTTVGQVAAIIKDAAVGAVSKILGEGIAKRVGGVIARLLAPYFF